MSHRRYLFSLKIGYALRECVAEGYGAGELRKDLVAGLTVGVIAIPLSMALAIASGVPPQHGLYTAIIAGFLIALTGGSRFSVSGPTAAFVVILYPVAQSHGLPGLLMASVLAGVMLILMAVCRLGRLIEYIPQAVTLGFTAGIAVVIATLQLSDFLGLHTGPAPEGYLQKWSVLIQYLPGLHGPSLLVAVITLATLILWPRLKTPLPAHLPAVLIGSLLAWCLNRYQLPVETLGSRFSFLLPDGSLGHGIPSVLPAVDWPWNHGAGGGNSHFWSWASWRELVPAAFAIAMLGAIESLLCAVVLDGMSGKRHSANSELLGQGIGNLVAPFFGGITATAAIARSAANFKAGARSPVASMIHAAVVLLGMVVLGPLLAYLPMPAMAALLMMVAWNMSEAHKAMRLLRRAPLGEVLVFLSCFSLTVFLDMVVAITVGVLLAALLFMREIAAMTRISDITNSPRLRDYQIPEQWGVLKIVGPLFFAAADRVFAEADGLAAGRSGVVLYMDGVSVLDGGGVSALQGFVDRCAASGCQVMVADLGFQPLKTLARAGMEPLPGKLRFSPSLDEALKSLA
ncbi:putative transporter [Alcanivorax xiamenensis]|uniref:Transporter n=1 Tax=Alcanivorax xiamenensis TaxID=1177156 RepID=A0ABQ6Y4T2_9GAMM|nr:C4-dicarboxylic acid transporter DauA [Alcanivorax xiamenensis]KAF0804196.1 putative transporter [Alcanivorax xiamenensis]